MFELKPGNAAGYLGYSCKAMELGGGVSNTVLLIEAGERRFVLKQSLGKLRVEQDWFSDRRRIFRESAAMRLLAQGTVPEILFEDRDNFLFAMSAAPSDAEPWKDQLLKGQVDSRVAVSAARILGGMIAESWQNENLQAEFGDRTVFDELRIDPYYRTTAARHPELKAQFAALMERTNARTVSLVHGDWSPKNLLVSGDRVMAIDFEVIHFGDPAFDAAFLLNHLLLKSFHRVQWRAAYREAALQFWTTLLPYIPSPSDWFEPAVIEHLGALLLARIDGKSPAEYIRDEGLKSEIRDFAAGLLLHPPVSVGGVFDRIESQRQQPR